MREATVTKKNANTTTQSAATARMPMPPTAPKTCGTRISTSCDRDDTDADEAQRQIVVGSQRRLLIAADALTELCRADAKTADHHRNAAYQRDDAGGRHGAGTDVAHVARPDLARRHVVDELHGLGKERHGLRVAPVGDRRNNDQPGQQAAADHDGGNARPEDVADTEQRGRQVHADFALFQERNLQVHVAGYDAQPGGQELEQRATGETVEHEARTTAADLVGDEHFGARGAFGIGQLAVLPFDQEASQRDHEQDAQQAAAHRQQRHLQQLRRHAPHEQRRQREDHAARQRARGRPGGLRDIGFEDRAADADARQRTKHGDGHYGHRDRRADGQAGAQPEVGICGTENDAEQNAETDRLQRELGRRFMRVDERIVLVALGDRYIGFLAQSFFSH